MPDAKALIVSEKPEDFSFLLPRALYDHVATVSSAAAAKQAISEMDPDIVIVSEPLSDISASQCAGELSAVFENGILLCVPSVQLDRTVYQMRDLPVFVLSTPLDHTLASQAASFLEKSNHNQRRLKRMIQKEKKKLQDEKTIFQCKLKLVQHYHWTEEKAHQYLQKTAMEHGRTRLDVAKVLLRRFELIEKDD